MQALDSENAATEINSAAGSCLCSGLQGATGCDVMVFICRRVWRLVCGSREDNEEAATRAQQAELRSLCAGRTWQHGKRTRIEEMRQFQYEFELGERGERSGGSQGGR